LNVQQQTGEETRFFFKSFGEEKINDPAATTNKLLNDFAGLAASGLGPDVASRPLIYMNRKAKYIFRSFHRHRVAVKVNSKNEYWSLMT
jgi:transketolase C-terminal domain/subunit